MDQQWTKRWGYEVRPTTVPGIHELRGGGYLVHGKITSTPGKQRTVSRTLRGVSLRDAQRVRLAMLDEAKDLRSESTPLFAEYARSLFERKVAQRDLKSAKTIERWDTTIRLHLGPVFGSLTVDAITKLDIEGWKTKVAKRIVAGRLSPRTANGWLSILRVILRTAVDDYELPRDPTLRVRDFSVEEHPTYTEEHPNALSPEQARRFLAKMRETFPQFYAMAFLGFVTGLRPSTLRPLRRRGAEVDVRWKEGALLIRRSNALGQEVMNTTKTDLRYRLGLSRDVMAVLEEHVAALTGKRKRSDLLFPSKRGGFMSRSALDKPFAATSEAIGLPFVLTPRGMRRTYQDLGRAAGIEKNVRRAICGHETEATSNLYETVLPPEMAAAVGKIARSLRGKRAA